MIDLLQGNLQDISEISADDPLEQIANIAQTALVPESHAPQYFNYGVLGNDIKIIEDTLVFARFFASNLFDAHGFNEFFILFAVTIWQGSKTLIAKPPST